MLNKHIGAAVAGMAAGTILGFCAASQAPFAAKGNAKPLLRLTLLGLLVGGGAGLLEQRRQDQARRRAPWGDWQELKLVRRQQESTEITSFYWEVVDGPALVSYQPGQFLPIQLSVPGQIAPVLRTYSLSDWPTQPGAPLQYRLSIKREPAPKGSDLPPGLVSNHLHDHAQVGYRLLGRPPAGSFVLRPNPSRALVLISNGVGITPMLAMAKASISEANSRPIWFLHGCRNGKYQAFHEEIRQLASGHPELKVHVAYSRPDPGDVGRYESEGYIDVALIRSLVQADADYYLCGSPAFMEAIVKGLQEAGVDSSAIAFEMFSKSRSAEAPAQPAGTGHAAKVRFERSQQEAEWQGTEDSLLAFAEAQGLKPNFACRSGVCGTCACSLLEGEVAYSEQPSAKVAEGKVLICISTPKSTNVRLDI